MFYVYITVCMYTFFDTLFVKYLKDNNEYNEDNYSLSYLSSIKKQK